MENNRCNFCSTFEFVKERDARHHEDGHTEQYRCALVRRSYKGDKFRGDTVFGSEELNYCPGCGRKLQLLTRR